MRHYCKQLKIFGAKETLIAFLVLCVGGVSLARAERGWKYTVSLQTQHTEKSLNAPSALHFDKTTSRYYVVDSGNDRLVSFDKEGKLLNFFDGRKKLLSPFDMVKSQDGTLWIIEKKRRSLTSIDLKSKVIRPYFLEFDGGKIAPHRVEISQNKLFVLDKITGDVFSLKENISVDQRYRCVACLEGFTDFKVENEFVFCLARNESTIYKFNLNGQVIKTINLDKEMDFPVSFDFSMDGPFYVLDRHQGTINVFDRSGNSIDSYFSQGHSRGKLYYPIEVRLDPWGRLCVVDEGNGRVDVFSR